MEKILPFFAYFFCGLRNPHVKTKPEPEPAKPEPDPAPEPETERFSSTVRRHILITRTSLPDGRITIHFIKTITCNLPRKFPPMEENANPLIPIHFETRRPFSHLVPCSTWKGSKKQQQAFDLAMNQVLISAPHLASVLRWGLYGVEIQDQGERILTHCVGAERPTDLYAFWLESGNKYGWVALDGKIRQLLRIWYGSKYPVVRWFIERRVAGFESKNAPKKASVPETPCPKKPSLLRRTLRRRRRDRRAD